MRALWTDDPATYEGRTVSFRDVHLTLSPTAGHGADHPRRQLRACDPPSGPDRRRLVPVHHRTGGLGSWRRPLRQSAEAAGRSG